MNVCLSLSYVLNAKVLVKSVEKTMEKKSWYVVLISKPYNYNYVI